MFTPTHNAASIRGHLCQSGHKWDFSCQCIKSINTVASKTNQVNRKKSSVACPDQWVICHVNLLTFCIRVKHQHQTLDWVDGCTVQQDSAPFLHSPWRDDQEFSWSCQPPSTLYVDSHISWSESLGFMFSHNTKDSL